MILIRLVMIIAAVTTVAIIYWGLNHRPPAPQQAMMAAPEAPAPAAAPATTDPAAAQAPTVGGAFTLTDQNGKVVKDTDFRGKLMLVFFGYTRCPDECPLAVGNMNQAMSLLGANAEQVVPVMISVDPAYDTPAILKAYVAPLDPRWIMLTGTQAQIDEAVHAYKAYAQPHASHEEDHAGQVDHSGFIYLMGRDGAYKIHFAGDADGKTLADGIAKQL